MNRNQRNMKKTYALCIICSILVITSAGVAEARGPRHGRPHHPALDNAQPRVQGVARGQKLRPVSAHRGHRAAGGMNRARQDNPVMIDDKTSAANFI